MPRTLLLEVGRITPCVPHRGLCRKIMTSCRKRKRGARRDAPYLVFVR
jgi:hypothetical protein